MRILYALDSYYPNIDGVGISIERQARQLKARGHSVALIVPAPSSVEYEEIHEELPVSHVRAATLFRPEWRLAIVPSELVGSTFDSFQPDLVVVCLPFPVALRAAWQARQRRLPVVGITGTMPEWLLYAVRWLKPLLSTVYGQLWGLLLSFYNRCDVVVGVTPTALSYLKSRGLDRPTAVISNGVDLSRFLPRARNETLAEELAVPDKPTVLYAGRLDSEKRMDVLIDAIPQVLENVDAHFIIGGDGSERQRLETQAAKLGVQDSVSFVGFLPADVYPQVHSLADVFAIASPAELQSIATLEAAASGLPIVAANAGALPELVQHGRNGYLFEDGDSQQLADHLSSLLRDTLLAKQMGLRSRAIASNHDLRRSIDAYEDLYHDVLINWPHGRYQPPKRRAA